MKLKLSFLLLCTLISFGVLAQSHKNEIGFQSDNDSFLGQGSDRYYTNGIFVYYRHALRVKADSTNLQNKVLGFEAGQKIFNPQSGQVPGPQYVDRPFAGYLYVGSSLNFLYRNESNLKLSAQVGIIGPGAQGYEVQHDIHQWFDFYSLAGWQYQIHDGAQLNLSAEYNRLLARASWIDVTASGYVNLGNGFTGAGVGPLVRIGDFNQLFNSVSTQSSSIRENKVAPLHQHEFFLYYKPQANVVAYDATIQGSLFNKTVYPEQITGTKNPFIFSNQIGASLTSNRFIVDADVIVNTRAVKEMVYSTHQWGSITIMYRFN